MLTFQYLITARHNHKFGIITIFIIFMIQEMCHTNVTGMIMIAPNFVLYYQLSF